MTFFTSKLPSWLQYLETLHPKSMDLGLQRIQQVAAKLQLSKFHCPVITVAGTNGKGSCVATLESIYSQMNYRVGAYSSPHLLQFNERIRLNGNPVTDAVLCELFEQIETARAEISLTYFEFTTLAALLLFQRSQLDVIILEVGLGGRLDAVNIVEPDMSVITTIALDHMEWLGQDREAIGKEKAGIFRPHKPVVCGDLQPPNSIYQAAAKLNTPLFCINRDFSYKSGETFWNWHFQQQSLTELPIPRLEIQNVATALMAAELLATKLPLTQVAIKTGISKAQLLGRFQQISYPMDNHKAAHCIIDVAHNPAAGEWLAKSLQAEPCVGKTYAVVGMLSDKDIKNTLLPLVDQVSQWYLGTLTVARGATSQDLAKTLWDIGVNQCYTCDSVENAFQQALLADNFQLDRDRIVVFGSFYTVAAVLNIFNH